MAEYMRVCTTYIVTFLYLRTFVLPPPAGSFTYYRFLPYRRAAAYKRSGY